MKKFYLFLFIFLIICIPTFATTTLYQKVVSSPISSGVTLKNYIRLTDDGWQNINVLEVNMEDKYTNLGLLKSSDGVSTLQNLLSMATNADSIAAINADFFQANSGRGNAVGLTVEDNEIISSAYYGNLDKNEFATIAFDKNNSIFYDYFTTTITLTSQKTKQSIVIGDINKYPRSFENLVIYTPEWGKYSHGSNTDLQLTEMVVKNNKVVEIRYNSEPVEIPNNGYVVSCIGTGADFINNNFKKGTKVKLDTKYNIDMNNISLAVSGGAILLKDGEIPEKFSSNISGNNPRTAIGSSKDESIVYLVTVDGRQKSSLGMTQTALAEFLKEIDVYNAINLDGGGSTTMVARKLGDTKLSTINYPSGGFLRSVINGIGVFNSAPSSSKVTNLIIEIDETNIFKNKERKITVKGYNKYFNPVSVNQNDVKWSYDGVPVKFKDGVISGDTVGMTMLSAKVGSAKTSIEINILSDPQELIIFPKTSSITSGKQIAFNIEAKNKNGYYANLNSDEVNWKIENYLFNGIEQDIIPEDATLKDGVFSATTAGEYIISINTDNIKSFALICVDADLQSKLPKDITGIDELQKHADLQDEYSFKIAVIDTISDSKLLINSFRNIKIKEAINNTDIAIFTSNTHYNLLNDVNVEKVICNKYSKTDFKNSTFITVDCINSGIRNTDSSAWIKIQDDIRQSNSNNIFIIMNNSLDNFSDNNEVKFWIDMLCDLRREVNKNIWVLHKGSYTAYSMERGIRYIGINNDTISADEIPQNTNYILITVNGKNLTYEIKNVFKNS